MVELTKQGHLFLFNCQTGVVTFLFLVGCASEETKAELEMELAELSDEELNLLSEEIEGKALTGQAEEIGGIIRPAIYRKVSKRTLSQYVSRELQRRDTTSIQARLPPEICDNNVDDNHDGVVDCFDEECLDSSDCMLCNVTENEWDYDTGVNIVNEAKSICNLRARQKNREIKKPELNAYQCNSVYKGIPIMWNYKSGRGYWFVGYTESYYADLVMSGLESDFRFNELDQLKADIDINPIAWSDFYEPSCS